MASTPVHARRRPGWWALTWRYGLSILWWLLIAAAGIAIVMLVASVPRFTPWFVALDLILGALMIAGIRWRHRHPVLIAVGYGMLAAFSGSGGVVASWAFMHLCTRRRWREVLPASALLMTAGLLADLVGLPIYANTSAQPAPHRPLAYWITMGIGTLLTTAVLVAIGFYVGARRDLMASLVERAETAEREQELRVLQGQAEERNRIAREMHDVLAHRLSLVSMHAGALSYRDNLSAEETREIARVIQENAHASLTELRGVLGQLRATDGTPDSPPEKPQPTLRDVRELIEDARSLGARIEVTHHLEHPELLPAQTGRHAYRVLQEALTNARKHAPHAKQYLELIGAPGEGLTITSRNHVTAQPGEVPGAGVGLVGLAERAQITGGRIEHGITPDGDFELKVWLPW